MARYSLYQIVRENESAALNVSCVQSPVLVKKVQSKLVFTLGESQSLEGDKTILVQATNSDLSPQTDSQVKFYRVLEEMLE